jgi:predicted nuclease with TOPRIM domain
MNRKELKINNKYIDIINSYDKNNNVIPELKNFKEDLNKKINEYQSLSKLKFLEIENERLNNDINMMNKKINKLENQISRLNYINNNSSKYEELFRNKKIIESRVTQQFLNTNYSDYVVY